MMGTVMTRRRLPVVLSQEEVRSVLNRLDGSEALVAGLLYGSGLRLMEALRLRVQDLDFAGSAITVRDGKGGKDRRTLLPRRLEEQLRQSDLTTDQSRVDAEARVKLAETEVASAEAQLAQQAPME